ncbi:MAG: IS21 family transposase [Lachnospiraceae bacterium]|nr:IS21 family transposase [Lachnospiraceae bacterium]
MNEEKCNDLQQILTQGIQKIQQKLGSQFDLDKINLAELSRLTGFSRSQLRTLQKNGFQVKPHGRTGKHASKTVLSGYTGILDHMLRLGITNSVVLTEKLRENGYSGSISSVKEYVSRHRDLIPPKRKLVEPQGNRGKRYHTGPGESCQMDWGFADVWNGTNKSFRTACFAMICHHCGRRHIEFFPNAKQENLFIGMIHGFQKMGVPKEILTDNMKSVVTGRDPDHHPIWNVEYENFMRTVGFETRLCKPRHPYTKGAVERLVQFVKGNFLAGRTFANITELNQEAQQWCEVQDSRYHQCVDCIPAEEHADRCRRTAAALSESRELAFYLCPVRCISFDGFVTYEGRRFGVPYTYSGRMCRVRRDEYTVTIYDLDLTHILTTHDVTWSRKDSFCKDQYLDTQPEEFPTMPVKSRIFQAEQLELPSGFEKFNFEEGIWDE